MARIFGLGRVPPRRITTDHVVPVHRLNNSQVLRRIMVGLTARFDDVLDVEVLHQALEALIARDGWRKLGGRLRLDALDKLEVHIPVEFTPSRPAVRLSQAVFDIAIDEHPLGCRLPRATGPRPSFHMGAPDLAALFYPADAPTCLEDFVYTDEPQLRLHVVSFADATLVSLLVPHVTGDAMALAGVVQGWVDMLHGREENIKRFQGFRTDPLVEVVEGEIVPNVKYALEDKILTGLRFVLFVVVFLWDVLFGPKMESRTLFFPASTVAQMRKRALADLVPQEDAPAPFLSDGDVLTAWISKMAATPFAVKSPQQALTIVNTVDLRTRLPSTLDPAAMYGQNMILSCFTLTSLGEAATAPLGAVAAGIRQSIVDQASEQQLTAFARIMWSHGSDRLVCSEVDTYVFAFTSWRKARFHKIIDFSPAVVRAAGGAGHEPGKPVLFLSSSTRMPPITRYLVNIIGEDGAGNHWAAVSFAPASILAIEEGMSRL